MSPFDARFVPHLRAAEDRHFWFVARNAVIAALVSQVEATLPSGYRVLEIGCGTGNTLRAIQSVCRRGSLIGMDLYQEALVLARERLECPLVRGDVFQPPFGQSTRFNIIAMFDVLEHLDGDEDVLAAVRSMLARDASLVLTVPAGKELWSAFDEAAGHRRRYSVEELDAKLVRTGYRVEYLSPFMSTLYPLAWMRRRLSRHSTTREGAFDFALRDLKIVPILNPLLHWALSREASLVSARAHLPFGTSLMAIARPSTGSRSL